MKLSIISNRHLTWGSLSAKKINSLISVHVVPYTMADLLTQALSSLSYIIEEFVNTKYLPAILTNISTSLIAYFTLSILAILLTVKKWSSSSDPTPSGNVYFFPTWLESKITSSPFITFFILRSTGSPRIVLIFGGKKTPHYVKSALFGDYFSTKTHDMGEIIFQSPLFGYYSFKNKQNTTHFFP